jgi:tRNA threonylcarbamoyl adenosine modification protein (Sua5/YciO/YrdC/YwlC family)
MPTDTVYGVAADPFDLAAMDRLFAVKGRDPDNPIPILGASAEALATIAVIDGAAARAAEQHWPGGLTLVVPVAEDVPAWIGDDRRTVAVRVPDHAVALDVLHATGPLAVTSANRSGQPPALTADEARLSLGYGVAVCLEGESGRGEASTVVDFCGSEPVVLRQGPVRFDA